MDYFDKLSGKIKSNWKNLIAGLKTYLKRLLFPLYLFPFKVITYTSFYLIKFLEKITKCNEDEKEFTWTAWEDEIIIEIKSFMKNIDKGMDGAFNFTILIDEMFFKDGRQTHGFPVPGVRLLLDRNDLKKLLEDLKTEMTK